MKIGKPFYQLTKDEYLFFIENHKQYSDFNTLGLYRSLLENESLALKDQLEIRDFAHTYFQKTFDFLQLKDPKTYFEIFYLGEEMTEGDVQNAWRIIRENQQKILKDKKIKHRNFGTYSIHDCGLSYCPYNGLMIKQNAFNSRSFMCFKTDENKDEKINKSKRQQKEKRTFNQRRFNVDDQ